MKIRSRMAVAAGRLRDKQSRWIFFVTRKFLLVLVFFLRFLIAVLILLVPPFNYRRVNVVLRDFYFCFLNWSKTNIAGDN